jgi:hypothetical protein
MPWSQNGRILPAVPSKRVAAVRHDEVPAVDLNGRTTGYISGVPLVNGGIVSYGTRGAAVTWQDPVWSAVSFSFIAAIVYATNNFHIRYRGGFELIIPQKAEDFANAHGSVLAAVAARLITPTVS